MTVYADELFIINFISLLAMLYIYSGFCELERAKLRLIVACIYGSILAVMRFVSSGYICIFLQLGEIIILLIAFKKISFKKAVLFFIMKYILSGIAVFIVSAFGASSALIKNGIIYLDIPAVLYGIVFALVYPIYSLTLLLLKRHRHNRIYTLIINKQAILALYDSGNALRNPYDGSGVIIVNKDCVNFDESAGFMLIPYRALNYSSMLKAFRADSILCKEKNLEIKNVTIGISETPLSESGQYQALIGPAIFKE